MKQLKDMQKTNLGKINEHYQKMNYDRENMKYVVENRHKEETE